MVTPGMTLDHGVLEGRFVRLEPLGEQHRDAVRQAAEADQQIWDLYPFSMAGEHFAAYWRRSSEENARGAVLSFAVIHQGRLVGVSSLIPDLHNRTVEIGGTYFHPDVRGTAVNPECKRLMLAYAFDSGAIRVGFKVDALNARSRAAVLKLGAMQEGIIRADRITWTGRVRDTVMFSVMAVEWPTVRDSLDGRLGDMTAS